MKFIVKADQHKRYYYCDSPDQVIMASTVDEVIPALQQVEHLQKKGYYLAGWISYEAATAFDSRQKVLRTKNFPLVLMMATQNVKEIDLKDLQQYQSSHICHSFKPHIKQSDYEQSCAKVLSYIYEGDIYQVNYSFRCDATINGSPLEIFQKLENEHPVPYSIYLETDDWQIISQSPELFLQKSGRKILSKPMKGTAKRELTFADDEKSRQNLSKDRKSQAENVMIVDLMRNDISRICQAHTVKVPELFTSTRYHSLHQLTSTVEGELRENISLVDTLQATFPAGSITGAPKIRAMEIIAELEEEGRQLYTGSAGVFLPGGDFILNVCIRTLICQGEKALLGIGSGVVADSAKSLEWEECLLKSRFLTPERRHSEVFETMLWHGHIHFFEQHLNRLEETCAYFLIPFDRQKVLARLNRELAGLKSMTPYKIRLAVKVDGSIKLAISPLHHLGWPEKELKVKISTQQTNSQSPYQYHKTDCRQLYDTEYNEAVAAGYDEVIFFNEKGELTEGAISNIFILTSGQWLTPAIDAGLLNGIWRQNTITQLDAIEQNLTLENLKKADQVIIGNSVRLRGRVGSLELNGKNLLQST